MKAEGEFSISSLTTITHLVKQNKNNLKKEKLNTQIKFLKANSKYIMNLFQSIKVINI